MRTPASPTIEIAAWSAFDIQAYWALTTYIYNALAIIVELSPIIIIIFTSLCYDYVCSVMVCSYHPLVVEWGSAVRMVHSALRLYSFPERSAEVIQKLHSTRNWGLADLASIKSMGNQRFFLGTNGKLPPPLLEFDWQTVLRSSPRTRFSRLAGSFSPAEKLLTGLPLFQSWAPSWNEDPPKKRHRIVSPFQPPPSLRPSSSRSARSSPLSYWCYISNWRFSSTSRTTIYFSHCKNATAITNTCSSFSAFFNTMAISSAAPGWSWCPRIAGISSPILLIAVLTTTVNGAIETLPSRSMKFGKAE